MNVVRYLRNPYVLAGIMFGISFLFHLQNILLEPYNAYEMRQWDTFAVIRNFAAYGTPIVSPQSNQIYASTHTPSERYYLLDFPIYAYTAALLSRLTGISFATARLVNIIATGLVTLVLFRLTLLFTKQRRAAVLAAVLFNTAAATVFLANAVQPDMFMLLFLTSGWLILAQERRPSWRGLLAFTLAVLVKTYVMLIVAPLVLYALFRTKDKGYLWYLLLPPLAYGAWLLSKYGTESFTYWWLPSPSSLWWNHQPYSTSIFALDTPSTGAFMLDSISKLVSGGVLTIPQAAAAAVGAGALWRTNRSAAAWLGIYALGFLIFFCVFLRGNNQHVYYPLPVITAGAIGAAYGLVVIGNRLRQWLQTRTLRSVGAALVLIIGCTVGVLFHVQLTAERSAALFRQHAMYRYIASWTRSQQLIPPQGTVLFYHEEATAVILTMMNRIGWTHTYFYLPCEEHRSLLSRLRPEYVVIYSLAHINPDDMIWRNEADLTRCIGEYTGTEPVYAQHRITVFDLTGTPY